jgi:hypothetical protein
MKREHLFALNWKRDQRARLGSRHWRTRCGPLYVSKARVSTYGRSLTQLRLMYSSVGATFHCIAPGCALI